MNASQKVLDRGLALVSAPADKRLALAAITLDVASLPGTTDSLHACLLGAWTSAGLFQRPVLCYLDASYRLVPGSLVNPSQPKRRDGPKTLASMLFILRRSPICLSTASDFLALKMRVYLYKGKVCDGSR